MNRNAPSAPSSGPRHLDFPRYDGTDRVAAGIDFVRKTLAEWHIGTASPQSDGESSVDIVLVAAELLGNAERHGRGTRSLEIERRGGRLRVTVGDRSPEPPRPVRPHQAERQGGHGLYIVERLATAWGWEPNGPGKTVWADLSVPVPRTR